MFPDWLQRKLQAVGLIVFDVDGVLTNRGIGLAGRSEFKIFDVTDGSAIMMAGRAGIEVALLTGRSSAAVARRARELALAHVIQGAKEKGPAFEALLAGAGVRADRTAAVGDDLIDLAVFARAGLSVAPADARWAVRARADLVLRAPGGAGAARELVEYILRAQGRWTEQCRRYVEP